RPVRDAPGRRADSLPRERRLCADDRSAVGPSVSSGKLCSYVGPRFSSGSTKEQTSMRVLAFVLTVFFGVAMLAGAQAPPSTAKGGRVFEMRTYYASPGKLEALHARFRDHTTKLFEKHGMTNVGYWVPIDGQTGAASGNTLVYILSYPSLD